METPCHIQSTESRESGAKEPDPRDPSHAPPGDATALHRRVVPSPRQPETLCYSPLEILYGRPPLVIKRGSPADRGSGTDPAQPQLGKGTRTHPWRNPRESTHPVGNGVCPQQPRAVGWVKDCKTELLQPVWTGAHMAIRAPPPATKGAGLTPWVHHSRVKGAAPTADTDIWVTARPPEDPLKIEFQRYPSPSPENVHPALATPGSWSVCVRWKLENFPRGTRRRPVLRWGTLTTGVPHPPAQGWALCCNPHDGAMVPGHSSVGVFPVCRSVGNCPPCGPKGVTSVGTVLWMAALLVIASHGKAARPWRAVVSQMAALANEPGCWACLSEDQGWSSHRGAVVNESNEEP